MKDWALGYAKRRVRRYLVSVGIGAVVVGGTFAKNALMGESPARTPRAASAVATAHAADAPAAAAPAGHDTAKSVSLEGAPTAAPAAAQQIRMPDIKGPIDKAKKAADATNRNIAEQTGQALPTRGGAAPAAPAPRSGPGSVPASPTALPALPGAGGVPPVTREVFTYVADGRRDPFYSLILTEDLRPLLSDLKLVGILYEPSGKRSVAIMRDLQTNAQYRVASGQTIGRMRVMQIKQKGVIFSIDEFGLSRQDSLVLTDTLKVRN